jgi:glycosyltransferase involved in cell wall biosynthesis
MTLRMRAVRLVIGLKRAAQAIGIRPRSADIYVDCIGDWRYPGYLVPALRRCGARVLEVPQRDAIAAWGADGFRNFVFRTRFVSEPDRAIAPIVVARDPERIGGERRSRVRVSVDWFARHLPDGDLVMPYFPDEYYWHHESEVADLRFTRRPFRIGFAGSTGDEVYTGHLAFPILGRQEVLATVREHFSGRMAEIGAAAELETVDPSATPIVFATTRGRRHVRTTHVLDTREYLAFLGRCDFFLAPPGFMMPVCHNVTEAMALRSIPILNYAEWLRPPLEEGVSCISFSTRDELVAAIERALSMSDQEIEEIRRGIAAYFDEHLSVDAFAERLCPVIDRSPTIVVNAEKDTVAAWRKRQDEVPLPD